MKQDNIGLYCLERVRVLLFYMLADRFIHGLPLQIPAVCDLARLLLPAWLSERIMGDISTFMIL